MTYYEKIQDLNVLFIRRIGSYASNTAWKAMAAYIKNNQLDRSRMRYFSIFHDDPQVTSEDRVRFDACIQTSQEIPVKGEISQQIIKGGKYAVFIHHGSHTGIQGVCDRIFLRWLPDSKENFDDVRSVFCELFNLEYVDVDKSKLITKMYIPLS